MKNKMKTKFQKQRTSDVCINNCSRQEKEQKNKQEQERDHDEKTVLFVARELPVTNEANARAEMG
jgi:hypothetical protein